ncbi:MAG TPA: hypothetical protein VFJ66_02910 [Gaiellales bacterium]|nr:hypothetical protein [Gaiellales bacterium]
MEQVKSSKGRRVASGYFTAQPVGDGFHVRDEVLGRTYTVPRVGQPTFDGRPVTNRLALSRVQAAVDACIEGALLAEVAEELADAA